MRAFVEELWIDRRDRRRAPAELARLQAASLAAVVRRARRTTPLYRELYRGLSDEAIRGHALEEIEGLPVVPSERLRRAPVGDRLSSEVDAARCLTRRTSGSSGIPLEIRLTQEEHERRMAIWYQSRWQAGIRPGLRQWTVGGFHARRITPWARYWHRYLTVDEAVAAWRRGGPEVLHAYPSQLVVFMEALRAAGLPGRPLRAITTGGESLVPETRRTVEAFFGARIVDFYGAHETGVVAGACPCGSGYHVASRQFILEILRDGRPARPGEEGDVVLTSLIADAMPLIRYSIGDYAVAGAPSCACGSPFPRIEAFVGRESDVIRTPEGRMMSAMMVNKPCFGVEGLLQYRVTQTAARSFRVDLVMADEPGAALLERIRRFYTENLGSVDIEVRRVASLPPDAAGKHRRFVALGGGSR